MKETIKKLKAALEPKYGKGESDAIIRLIFHYLKGWNLTDMLIHQDDTLSDYIKGEVDKILERLLQDEPIQYITGEARFHGMNFKVKPGVLIPRVETDELVDIIVDENKGREDLDVLDLCTGSGCIAIALARNLPFSKVTGVDFSSEAVEIAKENSRELKTKVELIEADVFDWEPQRKFDIIVSNPPYVLDREALEMDKNVLNYEPHEALFVRDEEPLVFYERIAEMGKKALKDNGKIYFEINPLMANDLKEMFERKGYSEVTVMKDTFGKDRFIKGVRS